MLINLDSFTYPIYEKSWAVQSFVSFMAAEFDILGGVQHEAKRFILGGPEDEKECEHENLLHTKEQHTPTL